MKLIFPLALIALGILVAVTLLLARLNWNDKLSGQLLSLAFVGTATAFVTVWLSLKEERQVAHFTTSIAIDEKHHLPPLMIPHGQLTNVMDRLMELGNLSRPARSEGEQAKLTVAVPQTAEETMRFGGELIQYAFVRELHRLQRPSTQVMTIRGADGRMVTRGATYTPYALSRIEKIPGKKIREVLRSNRFADSDMEQFSWENTSFPVPAGTRLHLGYRAAGEGVGPEQWTILLRKPNFFSYEIAISPLGATGPTSVPDGVVSPAEDTSTWQTYTYRVTITAVFEKLTSGNRHVAQYQAWASAMTQAFESRWSDAFNREPK